MNKLTFLITIHSEYESVFFFIELLKKYKKLNVLFAFDSRKEEVKEEILYAISKNKYEYYISGKNKGKLSLVIKSSKIIKTDFFKIIDQDDSLYLKRIDQLLEKLNYIENSNLIKHKALKIRKKGNNDIFLQSSSDDILEKQFAKGKDVFYAQQTNCDTIYPTKIIREMKNYKFTRQDFHNDVLLSNFCIATGSKLKRINDAFYIQFHSKGQTSSYNPKRSDCTLELYENYKKARLFDGKFDIKKTMWGKKISHKSFIANFTKWYLKNEEKEDGKVLYKKATNILNELWKK